MVQELWNIEQLFHEKFHKFIAQNSREIGVNSWYFWKALDKWDFVEVI
jgi:hypothetical protein